jgi:hypothetical protein
MRLVHPEADPDEVWIGNVYKVDFPAIGWETKRLGIKPLDMSGERLKGGNMRPVFVKRREIEAAGVPIPEYGPVDHRW